MSKQLKNQTYIYKIQAKWIIKSKFNYKLSIKQAKANKQLTPLADSQTLRFINDILELENNDDKINEIKECIDSLKRLEATKEIKKEIKRLYEEKDKLHFLPDYVNIEFATNDIEPTLVCVNGEFKFYYVFTVLSNTCTSCKYMVNTGFCEFNKENDELLENILLDELKYNLAN